MNCKNPTFCLYFVDKIWMRMSKLHTWVHTSQSSEDMKVGCFTIVPVGLSSSGVHRPESVCRLCVCVCAAKVQGSTLSDCGHHPGEGQPKTSNRRSHCKTSVTSTSSYSHRQCVKQELNTQWCTRSPHTAEKLLLYFCHAPGRQGGLSNDRFVGCSYQNCVPKLVCQILQGWAEERCLHRGIIFSSVLPNDDACFVWEVLTPPRLWLLQAASNALDNRWVQEECTGERVGVQVPNPGSFWFVLGFLSCILLHGHLGLESLSDCTSSFKYESLSFWMFSVSLESLFCISPLLEQHWKKVFLSISSANILLHFN